MKDKDFVGTLPKDSQITFSYSTCMFSLIFRVIKIENFTNYECRKDFNYIFLEILERVEELLREQLEAAIAERKEVKVTAPTNLGFFILTTTRKYSSLVDLAQLLLSAAI